MSYIEKHDKPEKYPHGYLEHSYRGKFNGISPLNKYGYTGGDTDLTMTIKFIMFLVFCLIIILGGFLILT
ncbi:MAG: hypothetical protein ACFFG0_02745 [Candidatus Thorarchaeota archaeon]